MKKDEGIQARLKKPINKEFRRLAKELFNSTPSSVVQELIAEFNENKSLQNRLRDRVKKCKSIPFDIKEIVKKK